MQKLSYKIINAITIYRIVAAPMLIYFVFTTNYDLYKWLLPVSFFTDLIDGLLARKFKVVSILGSRLDSVGDDLTILAAIIGIFVFKFDFVLSEIVIVIVLISLLAVQNAAALMKYKKITSFHTYMAKAAAIFQGTFFILLFILPQPVYVLFYIATVVSILDQIEEIILVFVLPKWEANVKGIYWVMQREKEE